MVGRILILSAAICLATSKNSAANLIITFANGDDLEGAGAGSTADYTDTMSSVTGTLTTQAVTDSSGVAGATLNPNSGTLGVNGATGGSFDNLESWTFFWNVNSSFLGIDVGAFTATNDERFTLRSTDWINLTGVSAMPSSVSTYDSATGTFTLRDNGSQDDFTLSDISGGVALNVTVGNNITIGYANTGGGSAQIEDITFSLSAVPEPASLLLFAAAIGGCLTGRSRGQMVRK